jgi:hypothetical protein
LEELEELLWLVGHSQTQTLSLSLDFLGEPCVWWIIGAAHSGDEAGGPSHKVTLSVLVIQVVLDDGTFSKPQF